MLQLTIPCTILARRARTLSLPVAMAMAAATVPQYASHLMWSQIFNSISATIGTAAATFGMGGALAVWAAGACSYALACDSDGLTLDSNRHCGDCCGDATAFPRSTTIADS